MKSARYILWFLIVATCPPTFAGKLDGKVISVIAPADLIVQDSAGVKRRIRIVGLGMPMPGHPRRSEALRELGHLAVNRPVRVETFSIAPGCAKGETCATWGRPTFSGLDPALALLKKGLAYHDRSQMAEQSTTDRMLFTEAQTEAQKYRRGVWHDPNGSFAKPKAAPTPKAPKTKKKKAKKPEDD